MRSNTRTVTLAGMALLLFTGIISMPVFAEPMELKFGHVGTPGSLFAASAEEFKPGG